MADATPKKSKKNAQKPEIAASQAIPEPTQTQESAPPKKKTGRPSSYDPDIAKQMCEQLSEGVPLREICRQDGFPAWRTVYLWMERDEDLSTAIARAREVGQDAIAEDILVEMNQEPERILSEGGGRIDSGYVQLIKARAEIKLKLLAKWNPKRYGDRVQVAGDAENPLAVTADVTLFDAILDNLEAKRQVNNAG